MRIPGLRGWILVCLIWCGLSAAQAASPVPTVIVVVGDSLTAGYGLRPEHAFPQILQQRLVDMGWPVTVRNAGVSGDTTAGGLARLEWALSPRPDAVILELGANDALRGLPTATTHANLRTMVSRLQAQGIPVLLAGMKAPRNYDDAYITAFDAIYPNLAAEFSIPLYPFFLDGVIDQPQLLLDDGLHPTPAGVQRIVDGILPQVLTLLRQISNLRPAS